MIYCPYESHDVFIDVPNKAFRCFSISCLMDTAPDLIIQTGMKLDLPVIYHGPNIMRRS